jgi:cytochrome b561
MHNQSPDPVGRYSAVAQTLHWLTAALLLAVVPIAWVMVNMPGNAKLAGLLYTVHESIGLTILALIAFRLAWRARHAPPPFPRSFAVWDRVAATASHWMLYAILVGMPVSGYLMNATSGYPISYLGLVNLPQLPKSAPISSAASWLHLAVGQWLVYALVILHLAATIWHVAVQRDGTLERMLPTQRNTLEDN